MSVQEYKCPACGAPLTIENRFSKTVVCKYCGQTSFITPAGLDPAGQKAELADFPSIFAIGKRGTLAGRPFVTLGRLRYAYEDGFWDEWFLSCDEGRTFVWLQEDEGDFTAFEKTSITSAIPGFDEIKVGSIVAVNTLSVFVTEKNRAKISGGEGEINFRFSPGEAVNYVDGNAAGQLVSIEFTPDEINLSTGAPIDVDQIIFSE